MYQFDNRTVLTLDAGGSNFAFSAIQGNKELFAPFTLPASPHNLDTCLDTLVQGFKQSISAVQAAGYLPPVAISFAFPGPADYKNGIIGDLPNFPAFRGGVPLGPFLEQYFNLPVFINNDGNLFAYGEALAGALPNINNILKERNCTRKYSNLIGITFGTGFGSGVVLNNILLDGDNGCGGDIWTSRNKKYPQMLCEENVSIRGVVREYHALSKTNHTDYSPKDIFDIAEGLEEGDQKAAQKSFALMGEVAGDSIANMLSTVDGLIVLGGGLIGAQKYIMPALMNELRTSLNTFSGQSFHRLEMEVFDLQNDLDVESFYTDRSESSFITAGALNTLDKSAIKYDKRKQTAITTSHLGTNHAISIGAYNFALYKIDND